METISSKDKNTPKNSVAFFDLDRTITNAISGQELARSAFRKGLLTGTGLARAVYLSFLFKLNFKDPEKIIDDMVAWVAGISEQAMTDLCTEVSRKVLLPSVYEEAKAEIIRHQKENSKVVILSSSLLPVCMEVARNLKMDDIVCTLLEVKNGILTGHTVGRLCYGEEKAVRLKKYCEINNTNISDAWYYGDSISDLPALIIAGNPVCINPDKKLREEALQRGWKILRWKN